MSAIRIRQVCLVAEELEPVLTNLIEVLELRPCYTDPGVKEFGLQNIILPVGSNFLEVVSPIKKNTAAGRYLDRRGGDGGYMVICQVDSEERQLEIKNNASQRKVRVAWQSTNQDFHCMQFHPADMGGAFLEVDWDVLGQFSGSWHPAGGSGWMDDHRPSSVLRVASLSIQSDDPGKLAAQWSFVAGVDSEKKGNQIFLRFSDTDLIFTNLKDNRGPGLSEISIEVRRIEKILLKAKKCDLEVGDRSVKICGVDFNLIERKN